MSSLSRRGFFAGGAAIVGLSACGNGVGSTGPRTLDARVDAAIDFMFANVPGTEDLASRAAGMLVMPLITEAAIGIGGGYGRGALRVNGV